MNKLVLLFFVVSILLEGCAPKTINWSKSDYTPESFRVDESQCQSEKMKAQSTAFSGDIVNEIMVLQNANDVYTNCMQGKGWSQEKDIKVSPVAERYKLAVVKQRKLFDPIDARIISVCRPMNDVDYVKCISDEESNYIKNSIHPDLWVSFFSERKEYLNMLLRKDISRIQLKEQGDKLHAIYSKKSEQRVQSDINSNTYTGNY